MATDGNSAKKYYYYIRLMGRIASHITLECALQTHPNVTLLGEEIEGEQGPPGLLLWKTVAVPQWARTASAERSGGVRVRLLAPCRTPAPLPSLPRPPTPQRAR
jgi:hypothetical protein